MIPFPSSSSATTPNRGIVRGTTGTLLALVTRSSPSRDVGFHFGTVRITSPALRCNLHWPLCTTVGGKRNQPHTRRAAPYGI